MENKREKMRDGKRMKEAWTIEIEEREGEREREMRNSQFSFIPTTARPF